MDNNYSLSEITNHKISNKSYISTLSYKTCMSLIKNLQQITMAVYMVTDCVEDEEPLRNEARSAVLMSMKSVSKVMGNVQTHSAEFRSAHANMQLLREHVSVLEVMGYVSAMNANILNTEIDKFIARLDTSILDIDSPHEARIPLRNDMTFGVDLGELFYKRNTGEEALVNDDNSSNTANVAPSTGYSTLGKIEKEMGKLKRKSTILKLFRELPTVAGEKTLSMNELIEKYTRFGGEGQISEKTLGRELLEMIADGTLEKIGTKRWVKYRLVHRSSSQ